MPNVISLPTAYEMSWNTFRFLFLPFKNIQMQESIPNTPSKATKDAYQLSQEELLEKKVNRRSLHPYAPTPAATKEASWGTSPRAGTQAGRQAHSLGYEANPCSARMSIPATQVQ